MNQVFTNTPTVSVIMPAYNCAHLIGEAIASVQAQTYQDWEIVVVDDGSTDETENVVSKLSVSDKRIRYHKTSNSGSPKARNLGFQLAKGEYVSVLDADDLWAKDKLEIQLQEIGDKSDTIVLGNVQRFSTDNDGRQLFGAVSTPPDDSQNYLHSLLSLELEQFVNFNTLLAPRNLIVENGGWSPEFITAHDWEVWIRLAKKYQFIHVDKVLQFYRKHRTSTTQSNKVTMALHYQLKVLDQYAPGGLMRAWQRLGYRGKRYHDMIDALLFQDQPTKALMLWLRAGADSNIALIPKGQIKFIKIIKCLSFKRG